MPVGSRSDSPSPPAHRTDSGSSWLHTYVRVHGKMRSGLIRMLRCYDMTLLQCNLCTYFYNMMVQLQKLATTPIAGNLFVAWK